MRFSMSSAAPRNCNLVRSKTAGTRTDLSQDRQALNLLAAPAHRCRDQREFEVKPVMSRSCYKLELCPDCVTLRVMIREQNGAGDDDNSKRDDGEH
jgi:hypothetical protein